MLELYIETDIGLELFDVYNSQEEMLPDLFELMISDVKCSVIKANNTERKVA